MTPLFNGAIAAGHKIVRGIKNIQSNLISVLFYYGVV